MKHYSKHNTDPKDYQTDFIFWFVLACTMVRLLLITNIPILGAEAYYWEWSKHLSWGYFDHPPMVAFLIALFTHLGSDSVLAVKLAAISAGLLSTGIYYLLARAMFGRAVAAIAACVLQVLPFFAAVNVLTVPDAPLTVFWILTIYHVYRATSEKKGWHWYAGGAALGLALLSKYHAFLLFPCVFLYLLFSPSSREWLRRKEPYVGVSIALLVFSPNLIWNLDRGLTTFHFLLAERHGSIEVSPAGLALFVGGFLLLLSPLFAVLVVRLLPQLVRRALQNADDRYLLLLATSLPVIVFFGALSLFINVGGHWPAVGYPSISLAAVAALMDPLTARGPYLSQRFPQLSIIVSAVLVLIAHLIPILVMYLPPAIYVGSYSIPLRSSRLYAEFHGWKELGEYVREVLKEMPDPEHTFVITNSYRFASQIHFYSGVSLITRTTGQKSPHQYDIWNKSQDLKAWDALFLDKKNKEKYRQGLVEHFERVDAFEPVIIRRDSEPLRTFYMVKCFGYKEQ